MGRKTNKKRLEKIYAMIEQNPGQHPALVARLLGLHRSTVARSLPALEDEGYLISEDQEGGLWPYLRQNR